MKIKKTLIITTETLFLTALMLFAIFPFSCRVSVSGLEIIGSNCPVPVLENWTITDSENLSISFSDEVYLSSYSITNAEEVTNSEIWSEITYSEDKRTVTAHLSKPTEIGVSYFFTGEVKNKNGSTLTFSFPWTGFNDQVPKLLLTETMDEPKTIKINTVEYTIYEFVEFYALTSGNLAGLQVYSSYDGEKSIFNFPAVNVQKGDFITVHYRNTRGAEELCINEDQGNITLSTAPGSSETGWDFWVPNDEARLGKTQDIIVLKNTNNNTLLQALLYSNSGKTEWIKDILESESELCIEAGIWGPDSLVESAAGDFTAYPNFTRLNLPELITSFNEGNLEWPVTSCKEDWKRFPKSQSSPGTWKEVQ